MPDRTEGTTAVRGSRGEKERVIYLVGVLYLPLAGFAPELKLEVGSVQTERPDTLKSGNRLDLTLDIHKFRKLSLKPDTKINAVRER